VFQRTFSTNIGQTTCATRDWCTVMQWMPYNFTAGSFRTKKTL